MQKIYYFIMALILTSGLYAQNPVPNPGFETWTGTDPDGWSNSEYITKSTDAHTGSNAAKGAFTGTGIPMLSVGAGNGFSTNTRWAYLNFYYKFVKTGSATISVSSYFDNPNYTIGQALRTISNASSGYTAVSIPVSYNLSGNPTDCTIGISLQNGSTGSYFIVDDVSLTAVPLFVETIEKESSLLHVYPNPATNTVAVDFETAAIKGTTLIKFTDLTGRIIKELAPASNHVLVDVSDIHAGNYLVVLKNDGMIKTKRLVIQ